MGPATHRRDRVDDAVALGRRGTHTSVSQLNADIRVWITSWNDNPRPHVWTELMAEDTSSRAVADRDGGAPSMRRRVESGPRRVMQLGAEHVPRRSAQPRWNTTSRARNPKTINPMMTATAGSMSTGSFMARTVVQPSVVETRKVLAVTIFEDFGP